MVLGQMKMDTDRSIRKGLFASTRMNQDFLQLIKIYIN
jgi:hypothetical protein